MAFFGPAFTTIMTVGAYWRCRSSSRVGSTPVKFHPRVLGVGPDRTECFLLWRQPTGTTCRRWFPVCLRCFLDAWLLPEVCQVGFHPRAHQGPHFRSAAATVVKFWIGLAGPGTAQIHRKSPSRTSVTTRDGPRFNGWGDVYPSKTTWINITRPDCATWKSCRRVF